MSEAQLEQPVDELSLGFARGAAELDEVYRTHGPLVFAIARRALGEDAAAEVTQDVFVSAWRGREQYDATKGPLGAWLVGITKRRIIDHVRRQRRHVDHRADLPDAGSHEPPTITDRTASDVDRIADRMTVADALRHLPERPRRMISMAYIDGFTHHEIAERTGLPLGTIKSDIRRGLISLRERVSLASTETGS